MIGPLRSMLFFGRAAESSPALAAELRIARNLSLPDFVMARAGVFALYSAWQGFGDVVAEALACGAPVVATDCRSGPAEILADRRHGRLVPVGDVDAMAAAMETALDHPGDPAPRRARAADLSVDAAVRRYLALFETLGRAEAPR